MNLGPLKRLVRAALQRSSWGQRWLFKRRLGVTGPHGMPEARWANAVLQSGAQVASSVEQVRALGLPAVEARPKNWDSLAALHLILENTPRSARIFDAGGERYSMILPWLCLYGYTHLIAGNLLFERPEKVGPILYEQADITKTKYPDGFFGAITCLSVIEHGVDLALYFREMARILAPGGLLITSTDYWDSPVDTRGQRAYGVPIRIFTKPEILAAVALARAHGFEPTSELDLGVGEPVVHWTPYDLRYTFAIFSLRKRGASARTR